MMQPEKGLEVSVVPQPNPGEIVLVRFDMDKIGMETAREIHIQLTKQFPYNQVVSIPLDWQFKYFTKEEFDNTLAALEKFLGNGQN